LLPRNIISHTLNGFAAAVVPNFDRALVVLVFWFRICPVSGLSPGQTSVFINPHVGKRDGKVAGLVDNLAVDFLRLAGYKTGIAVLE